LLDNPEMIQKDYENSAMPGMDGISLMFHGSACWAGVVYL
jgi:hypothetical protein